MCIRDRPMDAGQQLNKLTLRFNNKSDKHKSRNSAGSTAFKSYHSASNNYLCPCCKASHPIYMCDKFRALSTSEPVSYTHLYKTGTLWTTKPKNKIALKELIFF